MTSEINQAAVATFENSMVTVETYRELAHHAVDVHENWCESERKYQALLKRYAALEAATTLHTLVLCEIHGRGYRNEQGCPECQRDAALVRINKLEAALWATDSLMQMYSTKYNRALGEGTSTLPIRARFRVDANAALLAARGDGG